MQKYQINRNRTLHLNMISITDIKLYTYFVHQPNVNLEKIDACFSGADVFLLSFSCVLSGEFISKSTNLANTRTKYSTRMAPLMNPLVKLS